MDDSELLACLAADYRDPRDPATAVELTAPVPDALAVDGVDEVLKRFLAFGSVDWPEEFARIKGEHLAGEDGLDTIMVVAGRTVWTVRPSPRALAPSPPASAICEVE